MSKYDTMGDRELLNHAQKALDNSQFEEADSLARLVILRDLENDKALSIRAQAQVSMGDFKRAAIYLSQLGYSTSSGEAYERAARAYLEIDRIDSAAWSYEEAARFYTAKGQAELASAAESKAAELRKQLSS